MPEYIERADLLKTAKEFAQNFSSSCLATPHIIKAIENAPKADVVEVEKVEKAREEILSRMNEFMSEYMKHGSGADYYAGKSESMETAIRLVRAVFTNLLDETKKEGAGNENA